MKKMYIWLLVIAMSAGFLAGCREDPVQTDPTASAARNEQTQPEAVQDGTEFQESAIGQEDTYWVAAQWYSGDGEGAEGPHSLPTDEWYLDLILWTDGTARFRDIHEGICLMDDSCLKLRWERTPEGDFLFYTVLYPEPILRGVYENGVLSVEYWGTILTMRQEEMPQTAGKMYSPAELVGTWLQVSGETEGYQWEAMPAELSGITFEVNAYDETLTLTADMEERDYFGNMRYSDYEMEVALLREPLYDGCGNETWSVRIGGASPLDENGYPVETEFYATLLGDNELLVQRYYTMDGYPAVSHQIYRRFPDLVSWMTPEDMHLDYSNWVCTGYEDFSGEELPLPSELDGFAVVLSPDRTCLLYSGDGSAQEGVWMLGNGGVLLLRGDEEADEPFWFGGVISGYWVDTENGPVETYQMALYYGGGILKLSMSSYG